MEGLPFQKGLLNVLIVIRSWNKFTGDKDATTRQYYNNQPVLEILSDELAFLPESLWRIPEEESHAYLFTGPGLFRTHFRIDTGTMLDQRLITGLLVPAQHWLDEINAEPDESNTIREAKITMTQTLLEIPFDLFSETGDKQRDAGAKGFLRKIVARSVVVPYKDVLGAFYEACRRGYRDPAPLRVLAASTSDPSICNSILLEDRYRGSDGRYMNSIPGIREIREGLRQFVPPKLRYSESFTASRRRIGQIAFDFAEFGYPALQKCREDLVQS